MYASILVEATVSLEYNFMYGYHSYVISYGDYKDIK